MPKPTATISNPMTAVPLSTGTDVRTAAKNDLITLTSGLAPSYLQANVIILPARFAQDFRLLCLRNPVPCPLLAESRTPGSYDSLKSYVNGVTGEKLAASIDLRRDIPLYMVYKDGQLAKSHTKTITEEWSDDHVAFLIGCSYSFETALTANGLTPQHTVSGRNCSMYRTTIPLCPAGVFSSSTYVVSMRPYKRMDVKKVREITRPFVLTHGEPIAWGWEAVKALGIKDIHAPDWGDAPSGLYHKTKDQNHDHLVPVFWGCGVTPQEAVMRANLEGVVFGHAPGHMLLLDIKDEDIVGIPSNAAQ